MKHRRLSCASLLGAPAAILLVVTQAYFFVCGYMLLRPFLPAQASLPLPAGAGNHSYFTLLQCFTKSL